MPDTTKAVGQAVDQKALSLRLNACVEMGWTVVSVMLVDRQNVGER
jgi:hypothetical protein